MNKCGSHYSIERGRTCEDLGLGLKLHDQYVFGSLEVFKSLLRYTSEPPRAEFRSLYELLKLKQGKRGVHSYIHYIRHLTICIAANPPNEQTLVMFFMQGLTEGPVRTYLFRLEFGTLEEVIRVVKQEDFSVKQAHVSSNSYHPPRRPKNGRLEPMDICYAESETSRATNYKN